MLYEEGNTIALLVVIVFTTSVESSGRYKKCDSLTEHLQPTQGQCVEYVRCPRLLELAKNYSKTLDDFRVLRKLTCGFHKDKPRICCPENDIYHPPPRDEDELSKLPLLFPGDFATPEGVHRNHEPVLFEYGGSPDALYANTNMDELIPRLEDCGDPRLDVDNVNTRIIGGATAEPGDFPYMALLYRIDTETDEEEYYCSGTIINKHYILTAAHCILTNDNSTHKLAFVQVGITDVSQSCQRNNQRECLHERRYEVNKTIVHPKYVYGSRDRSHDIALIRTTLPLGLNKPYIQPVCLPFTKAYGISLSSSSIVDSKGDKRIPEMVDDWGVVAGWGRESNFGLPKSSTKLKSATLPVLSRSECQQRYVGQVKISDKQICAGGEQGADTCIGDSGGPLLTPFEPGNDAEGRYRGKMFQTGIISFGPAICGTTRKPSVYTRVLSYVDWILQNMHM